MLKPRARRKTGRLDAYDGETAKEAEETGAEETDAPRGEQQAPPDLDLYRRLSGLPQPSAGVDLQA